VVIVEAWIEVKMRANSRCVRTEEGDQLRVAVDNALGRINVFPPSPEKRRPAPGVRHYASTNTTRIRKR
jgi:hypothetical protein